MKTQRDMTGLPAVPFHLKEVSGRAYQLSDFAGHPLLLVFHRHLA